MMEVWDRPEDANSAEYPGIDAARAQSAAYPEIAPFFLGYPADDVFTAAQALVGERGWRELLSEAPAFDGPGRIEAVARTLIFGFEDDVAIRIEGRGPEQTRIDMRSASRFGRHDFGANADRIYRFLTDLQRRLDSPPEPAEGTVGETG